MKIFRLSLILLVIIIISSCSTPQEESNTSKIDNKDLPDQESWQSSVTITKEGRLVAEIKAGYIASYSKKNETILGDSIHVDFFNREGKHNSVLTAHSGIVFNQTTNLMATGNVVVISDSGMVLKTEELQWDNKMQKIISKVPVVFMSKTDTIFGDSFISDPDLKNYEIYNTRGYSKRLIPLDK